MHVFPQGLEYCQRILCINHTPNPRWVILSVTVYCFCFKTVLTSLCSPAHKTVLFLVCIFFFFFASAFCGREHPGACCRIRYRSRPLVFKNRQFCEDKYGMSVFCSEMRWTSSEMRWTNSSLSTRESWGNMTLNNSPHSNNLI